MGDWSMLEGQLVDTVGENLAASRGTIFGSAVAANTKGDWAEIAATTSYGADGLLIMMVPGNSGRGFLVDIGVGPLDSEVVIVPDLHVAASLTFCAYPFFIPIGIPPGTRIAARSQASTAPGSMYITISLASQGFLPSACLQRVTAYGVDTADSGGTGVDPGAVVNTKNAYSQINGATANPIRGLLVVFGNQRNATMTNCHWLADVAIGAAGSEQIIIPDIFLAANATDDNIFPLAVGPFYIDIPAGTRLAARAQCSINDATDRLFDIVLYGID